MEVHGVAEQGPSFTRKVGPQRDARRERRDRRVRIYNTAVLLIALVHRTRIAFTEQFKGYDRSLSCRPLTRRIHDIEERTEFLERTFLLRPEFSDQQ